MTSVQDDLVAALKAAIDRPTVKLLDPKNPPAWLVNAKAAIANAEAGRE